MTYLNQKLQESIDQQYSLQNLVLHPQDDRAIAMDETFLKINGKPYYIIIATGYASRKVLGLKVSKTRKMKDIEEVFLEADRNTHLPIQVITADAWGSTRSCARNLQREMTIIMHKHKKPYKDVVIEHYHYEKDQRKITTIGVKSDFTKRRAKREYYYTEKTENLNPPKKKKRGRPKGVKNGQGKKKKKNKQKKKRGRKGFRTVFDKGKRGYAKVDPYRKTIRVGKKISSAVAAALEETIKLFPKSFLQNNVAENINSMLSSSFVITGPKMAKGI